MYKSKFLYIPMLFVMSIAQAQTIEEAAESAKNRQLSALSSGANATAGSAEKIPPAALPNDLNNLANLDPYSNAKANSVPVKIPAGSMMVTSLYASDSWSQAGIDIDGTEVFVGLGDVLPGAWIVTNINSNHVVLKKCNQSKRCDKKVLAYTLTR